MDEPNKIFAEMRRNPQIDAKKEAAFRIWAKRKFGENHGFDDDLLRNIWLQESITALTPEEIRIIKELRAIDWGKLTVIKKGGVVVMITPAPDIKVSK